MTDLPGIRARLRAVNQEHLLRFVDELDSDARARLVASIEALPIDDLPALVKQHVLREDLGNDAHRDDFKSLEPAPCYPADPTGPSPGARSWDRQRAFAAGERLLRQGKVALLTVAGGQGTRLGFDGPKGCFPATPAAGKPLFRVLAEWILAAQQRYEVRIPWAIMTSPLNHEATMSFFNDQRFFGLSRRDIVFFRQGVMPSFDKDTGCVLLARKDAPATNPDGHGGTIRALCERGVAQHLASQGVEHVSYVQIDNPLVQPFDPVFLGLHATAADSSVEMSSKMIRKTDPAERVGVFCSLGGKTRIVEYSDLPDQLAKQRDANGQLRFCAGSPAMHIISLSFAQRLFADGVEHALPFHRAVKRVPYIDPETGKPVASAAPNAVKLEMFIFDALPLCQSSIVLEALREEEFAPIKNATGVDSPETSQRAQIARACRWLERAGVRVPRTSAGEPDCTVEISPLAAMTPDDLAQASDIPTRINPGDTLAL